MPVMFTINLWQNSNRLPLLTNPLQFNLEATRDALEEALRKPRSKSGRENINSTSIDVGTGLKHEFNKKVTAPKPKNRTIDATQIKRIADGYGGGKLLGMVLRKARSTEEFSEQELRTGFHVNEPAFERWKAANTLLKITHIKDDGSNKICEGVIYRTKLQRQVKDKRIRCGCDKGNKCNRGDKLGKNNWEEKIIPFGEFYREGQ